MGNTMKNKKLFVVLLVTSVLSALAVVLKFSFGDIFEEIICFPFEQIGFALRGLSLQGEIENIIAIIIYTFLSLSPLLLLLAHAKKKTIKIEDSLIIVLSLLLFYLLYMMINPSLIPMPLELTLGGNMAKSILCTAAYSVITTYFLLRAIRIFFASKTEKLHMYLSVLLLLTAMFFTVSIFGINLNDAFVQTTSIKTANIGSQNGLTTTYLFVAIKFIIDSIPSLVSILVILSSLYLIKELSADSYSQKAIDDSESLSKICKIGLVVTLCSGMAFNLLQLIFMGKLQSVNTFVQIPLTDILFVLGTLIFSRMVMANKTLKDENDSII